MIFCVGNTVCSDFQTQENTRPILHLGHLGETRLCRVEAFGHGSQTLLHIAITWQFKKKNLCLVSTLKRSDLFEGVHAEPWDF